ncbi:GtrA family protein [Actinoplanes sp. KI2]|uniref:GtrA family protein n=1 Tax=Actinoplanes sp. KI2 TaxID=2983315 RepID=UPI0021D5F68A|nr:GtrA family protein [Actinoplanes sp. KI2]MCU7722572.1 GtrA family protein [Actinoplanes sp. KI2]
MIQTELAPHEGLFPAYAPGSVTRRLVGALPAPVGQQLLRHRETVKFLTVGGFCFMLTVAVNYALKLTVLTTKPVTALTIATVIATIVSYVLNREWSFRTRGGRKRRHEAALFFGISGIGVVLNDVPMWVARYLFHLQAPAVSQLTQEISDFVAGILLGTLLAMAFRLWALKKWAFPQQDARSTTPARPL